MEISPYTGRPMTPVDAPRAPGQTDGYTSEGDIENAEVQAMNEGLGIDVPASRARFGRRIPQASSLEPDTLAAFDKMRADNARIIAEAIEANDGLPLNVVTHTTAESLALLQAISDSDQVRIGDLKLADAKGRPVRYGVAYTGNGHATFTILRAVSPIPGTLPTLVVQFRGSAGTVERFAHSLFDGWRWI